MFGLVRIFSDICVWWYVIPLHFICIMVVLKKIKIYCKVAWNGKERK